MNNEIEVSIKFYQKDKKKKQFGNTINILNEEIPLYSALEVEITDITNSLYKYLSAYYSQQHISNKSKFVKSAYKVLNVPISSGIKLSILHYTYCTYKDIFKTNMFRNRECHLRTGDIFHTYDGSLFYKSIVDRPIFILAIKKKYIRYVRQCAILNKPIDPRILIVYIHNRFDINDSNYRLLRPRYRKYAKKFFTEQGISIKTVNNNITFDGLFLTDDAYSCSSIRELKAEKQLTINQFSKYLQDFEKYEQLFFNLYKIKN